MSYCWRLQYYCKLGAAHGAGPIYYVFNSNRKHTRSETGGELGPFPEGAPGGRSGSLHCAGVEGDKELPAEAGRGIGVGLCARQSAVGGQ